MVGGQAIDLQAIRRAPGAGSREPEALTPDGLRDMHARKTGALIRASVAAGAIMGGATDALFAALEQYGTEIGLAFQIVDDILDEEGSAATLGKTAGKDRPRASRPIPRFSAWTAPVKWRPRVTRMRGAHSNELVCWIRGCRISPAGSSGANTERRALRV